MNYQAGWESRGSGTLPSPVIKHANPLIRGNPHKVQTTNPQKKVAEKTLQCCRISTLSRYMADSPILSGLWRRDADQNGDRKYLYNEDGRNR